MKIQIHEILLTIKVARELLRSSPEISEKIELLLSKEVVSLIEDSCLTVNQLSDYLNITTEETKNLLSMARKSKNGTCICYKY